MLTVLMPNRRRSGRTRRVGPLAGLLAVLLAPPSALAEAAAGAAAEEPSLDQLASTIGNLKASLSAIRQDLAAMHDPAAEVPPLDRSCAAVVAERAAWQHAEAAMTGELTGLRGRLAAAEAAVTELHQDREMLVRRIGELDAIIQETRTGEVVDALVAVEQPALEPAATSAGLLRVAPAVLAAEGLPARSGAARPPLARAGSRLDLQADLALAQLRIAELSNALDSARLREEAMAAEVTSLRSLTEAQIKRFMGRE